jgi:hypothetical protein
MTTRRLSGTQGLKGCETGGEIMSLKSQEGIKTESNATKKLGGYNLGAAVMIVSVVETLLSYGGLWDRIQMLNLTSQMLKHRADALSTKDTKERG